jgi:hypothetical protein
VLHPAFHVRAHAGAHLARVGVGSGNRDAEAQGRDDARCELVRLFHDRFLSKVGSRYLDRLLFPADSGGSGGLGEADSSRKL